MRKVGLEYLYYKFENHYQLQSCQNHYSFFVLIIFLDVI